jgi:hypothetical protein
MIDYCGGAGSNLHLSRDVHKLPRFFNEFGFEGGLRPQEFYVQPKTSAMKKYRLLKDLPGHTAGTVFIPQPPRGFCAESNSARYIFYLPSACMYDEEWFEEVVEKTTFSRQDMTDFANFVFTRNRTKDKTLDWEEVYLNEFLIGRI